MISHSAILSVLYKLLSLIIRKVLLLLNFLDASLQIAAQENRNQVFALAEDIVSATADDDTVFIAYHIGKCMERFFCQRPLRFAERRHREEQFIYRPLIEESLHLVEHSSLFSHFHQILTGIKRNTILFGEQLAHANSATSTLARYRNNHNSIKLKRI